MNKSSIRAPSLWRWWPCLWKRRVLGEGRNYLRLAAIGKATRNGNLVASIEEMDSRYGRINFYISPKRLYEETGYFWRGERR